MLQEILALNVWGFFLVFARVGSAFMFLPAFSASYVTIRARLGLSLLISFVLTPVLVYKLPVLPPTAAQMALLVIAEAIIGLFFGLVGRILVAALQAAGSFIALFASLSNALVQDPVAQQQSSVVAGFLSTVGFVMLFVTGMDHLMIRAVADSYAVFEPGAMLPMGDLANYVARQVADSFELGLKMAAPFALVGLTYYIGLGILGRLMPALPVFFFGLPVQISLQILVFSLALSAIMMVFLQHFENGLIRFTGG